MIEVDCSVLEGGGQIIRNCLAFAAVLQKPVHLFNIRHNRPKPGLSKQHLLVTQIVADLTRGRLEGSTLQSVDLRFTPSTTCTDAHSLSYDVGSAGSISLILQAVLPCLFFLPLSSPFQLTLLGGTDVPFSPLIDHVQHVLLPSLAGMGLSANLLTSRRGFYPAGGGVVDLTVLSAGAVGAVGAQGLDLTCPGRVLGVAGRLCGAGAHFTQLVAEKFEELLATALVRFFRTRALPEAEAYLAAKGLFGADLPVSALVGGDDGRGVTGRGGGGGGSGGTGGRGGRQHSSFSAQVWLITDSGVPISANMLFEGKRADFFTPVLAVEKIIHQLAWVVDNRACMDEHTADQLVIYLALGALTTSALPFRVLCAPRVDGNAGTLDASSLHIEAAAQVASLLTGVRVTVTEQPGGNRLISASLPTGNA